MTEEWPLIVFSVALQLSCGLCLSATLFDRTSHESDDPVMRPLAVAIFPVTALGLLTSLFHLGRPLSALRSLSNLGNSRLSLEILLSLLFALAALVYGCFWWRGLRQKRFTIGVVTTLAGLAAVASSFSVYMIPTQPAWNSGWLPVSFLGTVLLFAGIVPASLLELEDKRLLRTFLLLGFAGALALLVSITWMIAGLSRTTADDFASARLQGALHLLTSYHAVWLGLYLFSAIALPLAFALRLWPGRDNSVASTSADVGAFPLKTIVFFAIVAGALIGRILMYAVGTAVPPF